MKSGERIDKLLVTRGLADTRTKAQALIMAGVVLVNEKRVEKPSELFAADAAIRIKGDSPENKYVSRGGLKLEAALNDFEIDPTGRITYATAALTSWVGRETDYAIADVLATGDRTRFEQTLARVLEGKTATALIEVTLSTAAAQVPVELKLVASQRDGSKVTAVAGWFRDISMEKAKESAA